MKKNSLRFFVLLLATMVASVATSWVVTNKVMGQKSAAADKVVAMPTALVKQASDVLGALSQVDFTVAAERSVHSVVHVKTKYKSQQSYSSGSIFDFFFGYPDGGVPQSGGEQMSSGSGVIVSADGYIVTNNHVVDGASEVEVTLNDKRTFKAKVVGTDASTDLALLKIEADSLPLMAMGNSDVLKVGEWVLAVGNPFNLTSTVTAGIVSAKARNINILNSSLKIESFIQTDAAVNPGNSGGALVNVAGELVGINTAIASQTGSYAGYSFAIPVSIVAKVVADLKEYGVVQRAILGVQIRDITDEFAKEKELKTLDGVYVAGVVDKSSASAAGIKEGDVIVSVNGVEVKTSTQLQEQIGRFRPGDKVKVGFWRKSAKHEVMVELKNRSGNTSVVRVTDLGVLGATFRPASDTFRYKYRIDGGVVVSDVEKGGKFAKAGIEKGFVVLRINNEVVRTEADVEAVLSKAQEQGEQYKVLFVSGIYPDGKLRHYAVDLDEN